MKARQKGKINKRLEFEHTTKEEFYQLLKDGEERGKIFLEKNKELYLEWMKEFSLEQKQDCQLEHILNENISDLYEE